MTPPQVSQALLLALDVHGEQFDKTGAPYIWHPIRVAQQMEDETDQVIALLHDVLEDCPPGERDRYRNIIYGTFGVEVGDAVVAITHRRNEPRDDYYERVMANGRAHRVKVEDVYDNYMRVWRLPEPETRERLHKKYEHALDVLGESDD